MYEDRNRPLLSSRKFAGRAARHLLLALFLVGIALQIGVLGYHFVGGLSWIDSLLNASMISVAWNRSIRSIRPQPKFWLPVTPLFSGLAFIAIASLIVAPFAHRLLRRFHIDEK
jgi:H+/Cl- antiporter ClcA